MAQTSAGTNPCVCEGKDGHFVTDHEDEIIVAADVEDVKKRCTRCGRRFVMQYIPGDYTLGGHSDKPASGGSRGRYAFMATPGLQLDEVWDSGTKTEPAFTYWAQAGTLQDVTKLVKVLSDVDPAFGLYNVHVRQKMAIGERIEIEFCSSPEIDRVRAILSEAFGDSTVGESVGGVGGAIWRAKSGAGN